MNARVITAIWGMEPNREGEEPQGFIVGRACMTLANGAFVEAALVDRIERREENLGTYGVAWFDVYAGGRLTASMNALAVSEVRYAAPEVTE